MRSAGGRGLRRSRQHVQTVGVDESQQRAVGVNSGSHHRDDHALDDTLDAAFAVARFEYVIDVWLMAAMVEVGHAWTGGHLDIAQEHFISAGVMRRLEAAFDAAGRARSGRHVLTGLAPGATHQIATLAFATMLRRAGLRVTYLGPDLPVPSWVQAARTPTPAPS